MRKLTAIAFGVSALLVLSLSAGAAEAGQNGARKLKNWTWGPGDVRARPLPAFAPDALCRRAALQADRRLRG